jgi:pre-mRNA-splicing factor CDC5/CEF1
VRRLRPGELDPDPEVKPARPDPVDMDEDEKEMLSEARARLANTQGKKAKRKAREKQLEEARRLATLQKKRELKAAGITIHIKKKNKGVDYNADIPFQKRAPLGFWAVNEEKGKEDGEKQRFRATELQKLDGNRRKEEEAEAKKKEAQKKKGGKNDGFQAPAPRPPKTDELFSRRKKLMLPAPQVGEAELEEIVKLGYAGEAAKAVVDSEGASSSLLSDYSSVRPQGPIMTPRTAAPVDTVMIEARNQRAMNMSQTPLLGDMVDMTPAHEGGTGYDGITPRRAPMQTPNPLAAQLTPREGGGVGMTPRAGGRPGVAQTPLRDEMGINDDMMSEDGMGGGAMQKQRLADMFASLPKPKNDFEIVVPDAEEEQMEVERADREEAAPRTVEDMADRARRLAEAEAENRRKESERRTSAVKLGTPRPANLAPLEKMLKPLTKGATDDERIDQMIAEEVVRLVVQDSIEYPVTGQQPVPPRLEKFAEVQSFRDEEMEAARALIREELEKSGGMPATDVDQFDEIREKVAAPDKKSDHEAKMDYLQGLEEMREHMGRDSQRAARIEAKLTKTLAGYQARSSKFKGELAERWNEIEGLGLELQGFVELREQEETAIPLRISGLEEEVAKLRAKESSLQETYKARAERKSTLAIEIERVRAAYMAKTNGVNGTRE